MTDPATRKPRLSLTAKQLETPVALDLLSLLQSVTADGRLEDQEIAELTSWVASHAQSELPAVQHLKKVLESALADRKITLEERRWIHEEVEAILPPDVRREAGLRRREAKAEDRETAAAARDAEKAAEREERRRNVPIRTFDFMVAGVSYEGRQEIIESHVEVGDTVYLVREPDNPYGSTATGVRLADGQHIGYVPHEVSIDLAPVLDDGALQVAFVKKILAGQRRLIPVVNGRLYPSDSTADGAAAQPAFREIHARGSSRKGSGCSFLLALVGFGVLAVAGVCLFLD